MRFVFAIVLLAVLAEPANSAPAQPQSGTQLIDLCNHNITRCEQIIGLIIKIGVDAERLPECTSAVVLEDLTKRILDWWKLYPERAENPVVLSVALALKELKPC